MKKGFTLIELMVIVAIVGLMSILILAFLGTARSKGNDAAIKVNLNTIKNQAELYYATKGGGTYATGVSTDAHPTSCDSMMSAAQQNVFKDAHVARGLTAEYKIHGSDWSKVLCANDLGSNTYAVAVKSRAGDTTWYCLDSKTSIKTLTGVSGTPNLGGYGVTAECPAS